MKIPDRERTGLNLDTVLGKASSYAGYNSENGTTAHKANGEAKAKSLNHRRENIKVYDVTCYFIEVKSESGVVDKVDGKK